MTRVNRRSVVAALAVTAVAGAGIAAAVGSGSDTQPAPSDIAVRAALTEATEVQGRPVVDGTLRMVAAEDAARGGLGMWAYRSADGRDEVMITRDGSATFIAGCAAPTGALQLCGLRMRGGEGVVLVGRAAPEVDTVVVRSAIATRTVPSVAGHWIALLPEAPGDPDAALPTGVTALSGGAVAGEADPRLPGR